METEVVLVEPEVEVADLVSQEHDFKLELHIWPDPTLKAPVMNFPEKELGTPIVRRTAEKMLEMMYQYKGIGLAAQQVGVPFRLFVMDPQTDGTKNPRVFLNPRVTEIGDKMIQVLSPGEGCLSFPYGYRQPVPRVDRLELEWLDYDGSVRHEWFEGSDAIIIQHEMDHLMGYCFIDRLSWVKRTMAISKARRIRGQYRKGMRKGVAAVKNAKRTPEFNLKRMAAFEAGVRAREMAQALEDMPGNEGVEE